MPARIAIAGKLPFAREGIGLAAFNIVIVKSGGELSFAFWAMNFARYA